MCRHSHCNSNNRREQHKKYDDGGGNYPLLPLRHRLGACIFQVFDLRGYCEFALGGETLGEMGGRE